MGQAPMKRSFKSSAIKTGCKLKNTGSNGQLAIGNRHKLNRSWYSLLFANCPLVPFVWDCLFVFDITG